MDTLGGTVQERELQLIVPGEDNVFAEQLIEALKKNLTERGEDCCYFVKLPLPLTKFMQQSTDSEPWVSELKESLQHTASLLLVRSDPNLPTLLRNWNGETIVAIRPGDSEAPYLDTENLTVVAGEDPVDSLLLALKGRHPSYFQVTKTKLPVKPPSSLLQFLILFEEETSCLFIKRSLEQLVIDPKLTQIFIPPVRGASYFAEKIAPRKNSKLPVWLQALPGPEKESVLLVEDSPGVIPALHRYPQPAHLLLTGFTEPTLSPPGTTVVVGDDLFNLTEYSSDLHALFLHLVDQYPDRFSLVALPDFDETQEANELRTFLHSFREDLHSRASLPEKVQAVLDRIDTSGERHSSITCTTIKDIKWTPPQTLPKIDLREAAHVVTESHYGLEEIKERILDYLSDLAWAGKHRQLSPTPQALCLVGPPGVGKTSVARALAEATSRKLEIISLGGVDDLFLTGCDRAYAGSRPGEIVRRLAENHLHPSQVLFLLDEIDKLSESPIRSPYPPLLALLDPEQRSSWRDQHLNELPIDLSGALFVATANRLEDIPLPLQNRMEILTIEDYDQEEKFLIAKDYILPKLFKSRSIEGEVIVPDETIRTLVNHQKSSPGLRTIQQGLGTIVRRSLRHHEEKGTPFTATPELALHWIAPTTVKPSIGFAPKVDNSLEL